MNKTLSLVTCGLMALAFSSNAFAGDAQSRIDSRNKKIEKLKAANGDDQLRISNVKTIETKLNNLEGMRHNDGPAADKKCKAVDAVATEMNTLKTTPKINPFDGKFPSFQKRINKIRSSISKDFQKLKCDVIDRLVPDDTPVVE